MSMYVKEYLRDIYEVADSLRQGRIVYVTDTEEKEDAVAALMQVSRETSVPIIVSDVNLRNVLNEEYNDVTFSLLHEVTSLNRFHNNPNQNYLVMPGDAEWQDEIVHEFRQWRTPFSMVYQQ